MDGVRTMKMFHLPFGFLLTKIIIMLNICKFVELKNEVWFAYFFLEQFKFQRIKIYKEI